MRAGVRAGGSIGKPRCRRIFSMTARVSIVAIKRNRPPHSGHQGISDWGFRIAESLDRLLGPILRQTDGLD